jgi:hypothetical protein
MDLAIRIGHLELIGELVLRIVDRGREAIRVSHLVARESPFLMKKLGSDRGGRRVVLVWKIPG